jgi:hypothetical protein
VHPARRDPRRRPHHGPRAVHWPARARPAQQGVARHTARSTQTRQPVLAN